VQQCVIVQAPAAGGHGNCITCCGEALLISFPTVLYRRSCAHLADRGTGLGKVKQHVHKLALLCSSSICEVNLSHSASVRHLSGAHTSLHLAL